MLTPQKANQRTHDAKITSLWHQNDISTSFWRHNDVIIASCARTERSTRSLVAGTLDIPEHTCVESGRYLIVFRHTTETGKTTCNTGPLHTEAQIYHHFADDIFKCIFVNENVWISLKISLKFVPKFRIHNIPALVKIMAWRQQATSHHLNHWRLVYRRIYVSLGITQWNLPVPLHRKANNADIKCDSDVSLSTSCWQQFEFSVVWDATMLMWDH